MLKVAIIGAGGVIFAQKMVCDLLLDPELRHAEIALMDINPNGSKSRGNWICGWQNSSAFRPTSPRRPVWKRRSGARNT